MTSKRDNPGCQDGLADQPAWDHMPDPFTGEDWDHYIFYFEDCAQLAQWTDREKLLYLTISLKEQAKVYYSTIQDNERRSFKHLVKQLEQRFSNKQHQARWLSVLQKRTMREHETVAEFAEDISLLTQKAYVSLDQETQVMLAFQYFCGRVSPEMRCRLFDVDCMTIREAIEVAERY